LPAASFAETFSGDASVSGQVKDSVTEQPLEGVRVRLKCGMFREVVYTNAGGYYEFPPVPIYRQGVRLFNEALISASAGDYITKRKHVRLRPNRENEINFELRTRFKYPILAGQVTDSAASTGIANATVTVSNPADAEEKYTGITGDSGNYTIRIENKGVGKYNVTAVADGYLDSQPQYLKTFPSRTYTKNFTLVKTVLSVSVSPGSWNIGIIEANGIAAMQEADKITVRNDGNVNATYSLNLVDPQGWTALQAQQGAETYILNAAFDTDGSLEWQEAIHALSVEPVMSNSTRFAGDQAGTNVEPSGERTLWFQFKAPTQTSVDSEQSIQVIVSAELN
jgi:hypothetical protein